MKVVFLQRDSFIKLAVEQLCAVLKKHGYQCDLFIESGEKNFIRTTLESSADLFAFSFTTGDEDWVLQTAARLKKKSLTPVIAGGPHPTFFPGIIEDTNIDYICRGEGEEALVELLKNLADNPDNIKEIPNIWSKDSSGRVRRNEVRPFIKDLDVLPFPDFGIYARYKYMVSYNLDMFPVMTGRGCPYNCSYCFNRTYKELYREKGKYLRKRSPDNVIAELLAAKQTYGICKITFVDDSFFLFPGWLREFSALYKEKINLPFIINVEATQVKEDLVRMVKEMGCICIRMGLETGNDHLRQHVLNKKVTGEQIRRAAGLIKQYGVKLSTYNMLGLPGETVGNALETYKLNKEIRTDFAQCSLLQPYPGTAINKYVQENGFFLKQDGCPALNASFFVSSRIKLDNEIEITNLQKLMQFFLQTYIPLSLIQRIIKLPQNPVFHLIFKLSFIYNKMRIQKIRLIPTIKLGLHSLSYMK
ncbi:MAG: B12-binding domain-containing radical SAM protein [Planctomycetota bacterium]|jgi:radical SAM superfamily enzyme YgiQ (UPF0313 family)